MASNDSGNTLKLQVVHGTTKHQLSLDVATDKDLTVDDLVTAIATETEVGPSNQRIIFKGKSLTDKSATLASLGVKDGSKLMLIGKKFNPADDEMWKRIDKVQSSVNKTKEKLREIESEVEGIKQGYLTKTQEEESLRRLEKRSASCAEEFTRNLEQLDGLLLGDTGTETRAKRKKLVDNIQRLITKCDKASSEMTELSSRHKAIDNSAPYP